MKYKIKEILKDNNELVVRYKNNSFDCFDELPINVIDYITDLQTRIDKAIEMFDNEKLNNYYSGMSYEFEIDNFKKHLLKILKGEK